MIIQAINEGSSDQAACAHIVEDIHHHASQVPVVRYLLVSVM